MRTGQAIFKRSALYLALSSTLALPSMVNAQTDEQVQGIERIQVTGSRRTLNIQNVPINISALSSDIIEQQNIQDLSDIAQWIPGLSIPDQGGFYSSPIIIRGLNTNTSNANSDGGTVATYIGETPLLVDMKLIDMKRVEVLIGPQGTLYGAGNLAGTIRYIPNKPELDVIEGELYGDVQTITQSDDLGKNAGLVFNIPIINDTLAFRFAYDHDNEPGYIDYNYIVKEMGVSTPDPDWSNSEEVNQNTYKNNDANSNQTQTAKASLRWKINSDVESTLSYFYQDKEVNGRSLVSYNSLSHDNQLSSFIGKYESAARIPEKATSNTKLISLEVTADLGFAELTSATGHSAYKENQYLDQTNVFLNVCYWDRCPKNDQPPQEEVWYADFPALAAYSTNDLQEDITTQEIRLVSTPKGNLSWIIGGFYSKTDYNININDLSPSLGQYLHNRVPDTEFRGDGWDYYAKEHSKQVEKAIFGEISYKFTPKMTLTLGTRFYNYNIDEKGGRDYPIDILDYQESDILLSQDTLKYHGNLSKLNLSYQFSNELLGYFTYSEGFRLGGFNSEELCSTPLSNSDKDYGCVTAQEITYQPDITKNREVGIKSNLFENKLRINASVFYIEWEQAHLDSASTTGELGIITNAGNARSQGVDLSTQAVINNQLSLLASYSYTRAELTSNAPYLYGVLAKPGSELQNFNDGLMGERLPGSPEREFNLGLHYNIELNQHLILNINYGLNYRSDIYTTVGLKADGEVLPSYSVNNLSAQVSSQDWAVTLYIDNLFNKYTTTSVKNNKSNIGESKFPDDMSSSYTELQRNYGHYILKPRTIGIKFKYNFDL